MITWRELEAEIEDWVRRQDWSTTLGDWYAPHGFEANLARHLETWLAERIVRGQIQANSRNSPGFYDDDRRQADQTEPDAG